MNHIESTLHQPSFTRDFATVIDAAAEESDAEKKALVTRAMRDAYDELYPRWKGVVLTAEAEQEAEEKGKGAMPWIDVKFSGASPSARGTGPEYEKFEEYDISPVGGRMDLNQLAGYKYHIDLGGGGGEIEHAIEWQSFACLYFHYVIFSCALLLILLIDTLVIAMQAPPGVAQSSSLPCLACFFII